MPKIVPPARVAMFGALASLAMPAALVERALADKPSTPVTVTNPATSPALTSSVDDPGRIPYQLRQTQDCSGGTECTFTSPSVPAGKRLVIQDAFVAGHASNQTCLLTIGTSPLFQGPLINFAPTFLETFYFGDHPVQLYIDEGGSFGVDISCGGNLSGRSLITVTGYLLDCTVNHCEAIAP